MLKQGPGDVKPLELGGGSGGGRGEEEGLERGVFILGVRGGGTIPLPSPALYTSSPLARLLRAVRGGPSWPGDRYNRGGFVPRFPRTSINIFLLQRRLPPPHTPLSFPSPVAAASRSPRQTHKHAECRAPAPRSRSMNLRFAPRLVPGPPRGRPASFSLHISSCSLSPCIRHLPTEVGCGSAQCSFTAVTWPTLSIFAKLAGRLPDGPCRPGVAFHVH